MGLLELTKTLLGSQPGVTLFLIVSLVITTIAYHREKTKNNRVADERLKEAREDTELLVDTVNEAMNTVKEFKESNEALKAAFEVVTRAVMVRQERTPPAKGG